LNAISPLFSREEERLLRRLLGSSVPEFAVRFGAEGAIKRVEGELRRARRARSRKLYTFWSAVLARIEPAQKTTPVSATSESARVEGGDLSAPPEGVSPTKATLFGSVLLIDRAFGQGSGLRRRQRISRSRRSQTGDEP
jgi:hypothetical protein